MTKKTVLEKTGISDKTIRAFLSQGIIVRKKRLPTAKENVMQSPSEKFVVEWADKWTPPLSKSDLAKYIKSPSIFAKDAISAAKLMRKLCIVLLNALDKTSNLVPKEAMAAYLAILRVYYDSFDFQLYRFDRHFEYTQYKESPVGFVWISLKKIIKKVMRKDGHNVEIIFLDLIAFTGTESLSIQYQNICAELYEKLKTKNLTSLKPEIIIQKIGKGDPAQKLIQKGIRFYKSPQSIISDALKNQGEYIDTKEAKRKSDTVRKEIEQRLTAKEMRDLKKGIKAIDSFNVVQETICFILESEAPKGEPIRNAEFRTFDMIKELINKCPELVNNHAKKRVEEIFNLNGLESVVAPAMLMTEGESKHYFDKEVEKLYQLEIKRWI